MKTVLSSETLLSLAKSKAPGDRERLLMAIVDMCDAPHAGEAMKAPHLQTLLNSIFMSLVVEAEREIRKRLAEKLSTADWVPPALINVLALDDIEIARPVIAASPLLKDHDLVRLLVEATIEHQIEVARRPRLSQSVVSAILHQAEPEVLTALAGNPTADLSPSDMAELVEISRQVSALRTPLSCHPKLTDALAERLYLWVGQALRSSLAERFRLDTGALDQAIASAIAEVKTGAPMQKAVIVHDHDAEREEMERRLIEKLHLAGQLRPGYLVRALREGRLNLFVCALATLGKMEIPYVRSTVDSETPDAMAMACASVGIDRSVFPTILNLVRQLNAGKPLGGPDAVRKATAAFATAGAPQTFRPVPGRVN